MSLIKMAAVVIMVLALIKAASMLRIKQQRRPIAEEQKDKGVMV